MNEMLLSILLIIFGLVCGFGLTFLVAFLREGTTSKKIDKMLSDAEKNADKIKRDAVMEAKEKSYQLKLEVDKDIKEKKAELKDRVELRDEIEEKVREFYGISLNKTGE